MLSLDRMCGKRRLEGSLIETVPHPEGLPRLCSEDFPHPADFLLHFPTYLFVVAFAFQVGSVRQLSGLLRDLRSTNSDG